MNELIQIVDCLPPLTVNRIVERLKQKTQLFGGAPIYNGDNDNYVDTSVRSNTAISLEDYDPLSKSLSIGFDRGLEQYKQTLVNFHHTYNNYPLPNTVNTTVVRERIQVLRYEPGQQYIWHTDQFPQREHEHHAREISAVMYLTNNFTGGTTMTPIGNYKPKPGQAIIFPSNWCFPHAAEEVTSGIKLAAVAWFNVYHDN